MPPKKQGKRKLGQGNTATVTARPEELPPAEAEVSLDVSAVLPPGAEEAWPHQELFLREHRVAAHPLYRSDLSSVTALGGVLTESETRAWQAWGEAQGYELAKHPQGNGMAHRDCWRLALEDEAIAETIFSRLRPFLPPTIDASGQCWDLHGCASNLRLYKYGEGQRFGKHYDQSDLSDDGETCTFFTVLLYLNSSLETGGERPAPDPVNPTGAGSEPLGPEGAAGGTGLLVIEESGAPLQGGSTAFYEGHGGRPCCSFAPRRGFCLIHEHGDRCLLHEGCVVNGGSKFLLRTDVVFKRRREGKGPSSNQNRPSAMPAGKSKANGKSKNKRAT